tara:strand:+ start:751 stop:966 length:216 start_codon:yes stop_codon:yes gene_type:complete
MVRMKEFSRFLNWIIKDNIHPGSWSADGDTNHRLVSMGASEHSVSYEIEQHVEDERRIYIVDIKSKEVSNV